MRRPDGPRLTGGTARGVRLFSVPGLDVRPATSRLRVSVFEILRPRLDGARVADLFAGTGCLGLEALSRGAARAVFLDVDPRALEAVRLNLDRLRFADRAEVRQADAFRDAPGLEPADLVFVAPPYRFFVDRAEELRRLAGSVRLAAGGVVVVEHRPGEGLGQVAGRRVDDERVYGGSVATFYVDA
jgi:16S rRNA (guanine(966)-N(2))-methyltransferase RsmD